MVVLMRSKSVDIGPHCETARYHILDSLSICAHDHILSGKLLDRFSGATGSIVAIAGDWFDFDRISNYELYPGGPTGEDYASGERPTERLVALVSEFLAETEDAIVVCENWGAERRHNIASWPWAPPRISCLGERDIYHILTQGMNNPEMIEAAVVPRHHWQTGVCSTCPCFPDGDIPNEEFLDNIVQNTKKIFVPAFDGTGYLIWTLSE
jgi:hypothetical protein